jgi:formylglycine-generating enzyme required for sulfatase activity
VAREAIFIGYRREDTADVAGRVYDALEARFGRKRVFKDVDNLRPGADFGAYIKSVLPQCRVALILIGPNWVSAADEEARRRLDDPNDWVRIEVETALGLDGLDVVPVLVNGARMPKAEELPRSLQPLLRRHAATIRRDPDFRDDIGRLATALRSSVRTGFLDLEAIGGDRRPFAAAATPQTGRVRGVISLGAVGVVLLGVMLWSPWNNGDPGPSEPAEQGAVTEAPPGAAAAEALPQQGGQSTPVQPPPAALPSADAPMQQRVQTAPPPSAETPPPAEPAPARAINEQPRAAEAVATPPPQTRTSPPPAPSVRVIEPEMVRIPGQNFEVGRYEVTFEEWDACVADDGCNGYTPADYGWGRGRRPVINVSWEDAQAYTQWLSGRTGQQYRLLTSAEWEIAARAGSTRDFSWGEDPPVCDPNARTGANFGGCPDRRTQPVGSFRPNRFGLYDVHGNVAEWVQDAEGGNRVLRGGSLDRNPLQLRFADWDSNAPTRRYRNLGFRLARTL